MKNSFGYRFQVGCAKVVDHNAIQFLMTMVTLYALLADDLRLICTSMETDSYFTIMTSVALVLFLMELSLASIG